MIPGSEKMKTLLIYPPFQVGSGMGKVILFPLVQIIAKKYDELKVLQASKAFQDLAPWQNKHRPIP